MKIIDTHNSIELIGNRKGKGKRKTDICKRYNYYSSTELGKENKNKRCEISEKNLLKKNVHKCFETLLN